jgi:hypothetical protein
VPATRPAPRRLHLAPTTAIHCRQFLTIRKEPKVEVRLRPRPAGSGEHFQPRPKRSRPRPPPAIRTAAAVTGVSALIAAGGFLATTTNGPDTASPRSSAGTEVNPSAQTQRELHQSVAGQYGNHSAQDAAVNPSVQVRRALRDSIAHQYGPAH